MKLIFGTWNVRTLLETGKLKNVTIEMNRLQIEILGVSETRWMNSGNFESDDYKIYYSGVDNGKHRSGVAIIVSNKIAKSIMHYAAITDRIILLQLNNFLTPLNVI